MTARISTAMIGDSGISDSGTEELHARGLTGLLVIRHAPTPWNHAKKLQGRSDIPLDDAGRAMAMSWRPAAAAWSAWRLLSSPLSRARETADLLFPGGLIASDPRLVEMSFGAWEGRTLAELRAEPGADVNEREVMGLDFHAPGGESPRQVQQRLAPLLGEIATDRCDTVLIAHKAVLRALYARAVGWDMLAKPPQKLHFACAHLFGLAGDGGLELVRLNLPLQAPGKPTERPTAKPDEGPTPKPAEKPTGAPRGTQPGQGKKT